MTDSLDRSRWFVLDTNAGSWVVRDEVRELVEFRHHNLVTDPPPFEAEQIDLILCRNVTIYFDRETTRRLMKRLHGRLRDGGYLFLGHAETLWQISDDFSLGAARRRVRLPPARGAQGTASRGAPILRDRRTEEELRPTRADRRRGDTDRRGRKDEPIPATDARRPRRPSAAPAVPVQPTRDPLDAVRSAMLQGQYDEAADIAAEVVAATPLWAQAHYLQGVALTNLGPGCRCSGRAAQGRLPRP